jgi:6-pyruvoyltetrahydropterin/6-carboxytetrahydropterin synthase|tara:strand:- start:984 stop:1253 length:270 start_codon:yes stop_codon:yes gene_type:complete
VHVEVEGEEGDDGIIIDTGELDKVFQYIFDTLDHRYLNDIPGLENPTTENLCKWIWDRVFKVIGDHPQIHKVGIFVWESNDSYGFYDGP